MRMSVAERDYFEMLKEDWNTYEISFCPDREHPFEAYPHTDPGTVLTAPTAQQLRALIRIDHVNRTRT